MQRVSARLRHISHNYITIHHHSCTNEHEYSDTIDYTRDVDEQIILISRSLSLLLFLSCQNIDDVDLWSLLLGCKLSCIEFFTLVRHGSNRTVCVCVCKNGTQRDRYVRQNNCCQLRNCGGKCS